MAKKNIPDIEKRIKKKQSIRKRKQLKDKSSKLLFRLSVLCNILMGIHIYEPNLLPKLTNDFIDMISKVAPLVESLINQLPL